MTAVVFIMTVVDPLFYERLQRSMPANPKPYKS